MKLLFIQTDTITDSISNQSQIIEEKTLSIIDLIASGGTGGNIIMGTLAILSLFAVYIFFERLSAIKRASQEDQNFLKSIQNFVEAKDINAAKTLCKNTDSPIARMIEKGVNRIDKPMTDISAAIENQAKLEIYKMENNLANLATIAGAAPMIGFLGTVIGMILSIFEISNAGGNIDMQLLASGLYTAMTTTVAGLIVGILGYITYNHLVVKTNKVVYQMEATSLEFFDLLNEPA
jgi:biopolymer transport protein ExbB